MKEVYKVLCAFFKKFNQDAAVLNAPKKTSIGCKFFKIKNSKKTK
jgi:hypothetical protein